MKIDLDGNYSFAYFWINISQSEKEIINEWILAKNKCALGSLSYFSLSK